MVTLWYFIDESERNSAVTERDGHDMCAGHRVFEPDGSKQYSDGGVQKQYQALQSGAKILQPHEIEQAGQIIANQPQCANE